MMERPVCRIPVRPSTPLYDVLVDSDLDIRGRTYLDDRKIVLRNWDEEVLLHELLHALLHEGRMVTTPGYGDDRSLIVQWNEEDLVSHVSHGLYQAGFRWVEYEQSEAEHSDGAVVSRHVADIDTDEDGWYWVACECGWCNGPFPGPVEAADDFEDHRFAVDGGAP